MNVTETGDTNTKLLFFFCLSGGGQLLANDDNKLLTNIIALVQTNQQP